MNTSDVLNKAADLIEQRGWAKAAGWFPKPDDEGPVCIEGALNALLGQRAKWECPAWIAVASHIADRPDVDIHPMSGYPIVWSWNDAPDRTQFEVIEVLRAAAVVEAAREDQDAAWSTYAELVTA